MNKTLKSAHQRAEFAARESDAPTLKGGLKKAEEQRIAEWLKKRKQPNLSAWRRRRP